MLCCHYSYASWHHGAMSDVCAVCNTVAGAGTVATVKTGCKFADTRLLLQARQSLLLGTEM